MSCDWDLQNSNNMVFGLSKLNESFGLGDEMMNLSVYLVEMS